MPLRIEGPVSPIVRRDFSFQKRQQVHAVDGQALGECGATRGRDGRHDVDEVGDAVNPELGGEPSGPADGARNADPAFVWRALDVPEAGVETSLSLVGLRAAGAVVAHEDEDGVLREPEFVELVQQLADVVVDILDHAVDAGEGVVEAHLAIRLDPFVTDLERGVRCVRREVNEERLVLVFLDEADRGIPEEVRAVTGVLFLFAVVPELGIEVRVALEVRGLAHPAAVVPQHFFEALVHRPHGVIVAEMPLAEEAGAVAPVTQYLRQGHFLGIHHRPAEVRVDGPRAVVVASGHQARARRRADRAGVEPFHLRPFRVEPIQVGCAQMAIPVRAEVTPALVIGQDDHDIRQ